ncbi:unnamed protein product [Durusdinium trenchii]|uniref:Uncharacterized protein n=1 Tax=Durusdinium trenchii TaxID=1381693 RepID=A0ABP0KZV7_9DINO
MALPHHVTMAAPHAMQLSRLQGGCPVHPQGSPGTLHLHAMVPLPVPVGTQAMVGGKQIAMPPQPASLTRHLPPPDVVNAQKEQNYREVDEQLHQAQLLLEDQTRREKDFLRAQASQAKEVAAGRWDQHLRAQEISAEQDFQKSLAELHESARQMRLKLEEQANQLVVEYQARRTQEDINRHKHEVEMHHWEGRAVVGLPPASLSIILIHVCEPASCSTVACWSSLSPSFSNLFGGASLNAMQFLISCLLSILLANGLEVRYDADHQIEEGRPKEHRHRQIPVTSKVQKSRAKSETEVNSKGSLTHRKPVRHSKKAPERKHTNRRMEARGQRVLPVTFFQEESEQGPFHRPDEMRIVRETGEMPMAGRDVAELHEKDDLDLDDLEDPAAEGEPEDSDDFTLPRRDEKKEELPAHSDDASVVELSTPSIVRREVERTVQRSGENVLVDWMAKRFGLDVHTKVAHGGRNMLLCCFILILVLAVLLGLMFLATVKADTVIKRASHAIVEPTGSELKEKKERVSRPEGPSKSLASLVEGSLGQCAVRKSKKDDKDPHNSDLGPSGGLRSCIEALPVSAAPHVEKLLPSAGGYDVTFSKPMSSRWLLRLEAVIQDPADTEPLQSPLTRRPCVLYTAHASRKVHGGMSVPLAFASQHMDFSVTLRGSPSVVIRVAGSEVNLFATKECEFAEVLPFPCAPDHWQDFVSVHLPGAGTGSSDNHALENELRAKGTAVEFHECCLKTGDTVTLVGELLRSANGELTLQPLSREVSWKRTSWERAGIGEEDILELLEARTHVLISDDPTLLS